MQLDFNAPELTIKLVYYGPALSGKTSNLSALHGRIPEPNRGRLMALDTRDDRTLFFDMLPIAVRSASGLNLRLKLYTVPGQVIHNATRRIVLQGADGVAFIADSRRKETQANALAFQNLAENLRENGMDIRALPLVIQFNKRDLPDVRSDREIDEVAKKGREPVFKAVATEGLGVMDTFLGLVRLTWRHIEKQHGIAEKFRIEEHAFMNELCRALDARAEGRGAGGA